MNGLRWMSLNHIIINKKRRKILRIRRTSSFSFRKEWKVCFWYYRRWSEWKYNKKASIIIISSIHISTWTVIFFVYRKQSIQQFVSLSSSHHSSSYSADEKGTTTISKTMNFFSLSLEEEWMVRYGNSKVCDINFYILPNFQQQQQLLYKRICQTSSHEENKWRNRQRKDIEFEETEMNMKWKEMINFLHKKEKKTLDRARMMQCSMRERKQWHKKS